MVFRGNGLQIDYELFSSQSLTVTDFARILRLTVGTVVKSIRILLCLTDDIIFFNVTSEIYECLKCNLLFRLAK
jgi:hypothetical protein